MEDKKDIFSDIKPEKEQKIMSFSEGFRHVFKGFGHLFRGIFNIFFVKFAMNLLILLILLGAAVSLTFYLKPATTGAVVAEQKCEETICPELNCSECPALVEKENVTLYKYRYKCANGAIVDEEEDCKPVIPEITTSDVASAKGITISIDNVDYTMYDSNSGKLTKIEYTIINKGDKEIVPDVELKMYSIWDEDMASASPLRTFSTEKSLRKDEWIKRSESINLNFEGTSKTIRLSLKNIMAHPDEYIVAVTKLVSFS